VKTLNARTLAGLRLQACSALELSWHWPPHLSTEQYCTVLSEANVGDHQAWSAPDQAVKARCLEVSTGVDQLYVQCCMKYVRFSAGRVCTG